MSQEVSGEELGVTLLDCIRDGRVPRPEEMSWQRWRKREGRRPTRRQDGRGMSTVEEVALWRAVTAELYGEDRIEDLEEEEEQDEEEEPEARPRLRPIPALMGPAEPDVGTRPSPRPVGFAGEAPGEQARPAIRDEGGRGEEKGRASPAPSSGYTGVSMSEMQRKLFALHDPRYESLAAYRARAERISHALEVLGQEVGPADLRSVIMKAELIQEGYEALGDFDPRTMVGHLKEQFIMLANDDTKEPEEKGLTTVAIAELIQDVGGRVSTAPDKVFSTPSDELQDDRNRGSDHRRDGPFRLQPGERHSLKDFNSQVRDGSSSLQPGEPSLRS